MPAHRSGKLKQGNKAHKRAGGHTSKRGISRRDAGFGKVEGGGGGGGGGGKRKGVKDADVSGANRRDRVNRARQLQRNKRDSNLQSRRLGAGGQRGAPKCIGVVSLGPRVDLDEIAASILRAASRTSADATHVASGKAGAAAGGVHDAAHLAVSSARAAGEPITMVTKDGKDRFTIVVADPFETAQGGGGGGGGGFVTESAAVMCALDVAKVADVLVLAVDVSACLADVPAGARGAAGTYTTITYLTILSVLTFLY